MALQESNILTRNCTLLLLLFILFLMSSITPLCALDMWMNVKGNQKCSPQVYLEPLNFEELCKYIQRNANECLRIRAIGSGCSVSDIGCTEGCLLNLKYLNKILSINIDKKTVRVETGILIKDLNDQLATHNLSLPNQVTIPEITLGGAISTGAHGAGHTGSLSSFIKEFELITSDGNVHKISLDSDPEAFSALRVSLGSLGIIYAVTVQCESLFYVKPTKKITNIETVIKHYMDIHASNDFCHFLWNVETGSVTIEEWNKCSQDRQKEISNRSLEECIPGYQALAWGAVNREDKNLFSETAISIKYLPNAIMAIQELVQRHKNSEVKVLDIYIRFVELDSDALLSPSSKEQVVYLTFSVSEGSKYIDLYREFEESMDKYRGKPHWGKINFLDYQKVHALYGINLNRFIHVKNRLDPKGTFSNDFIDRILLP